MQWPGAGILIVSGITFFSLLFLPVYFFTGIKNSETKINTMVSSVLIIAGAGLLMSLVRSPENSTFINTLNTEHFLRTEQLLNQAQKQAGFFTETATVPEKNNGQSREIYALSDDLKTYIIEQETGYKTLPADFKEKEILLKDGWVRDYFKEGTPPAARLSNLHKKVKAYNQNNATIPGFLPIPVENTFLDRSEERTLASLNNLTRIQMQVFQNEMLAASAK